MAGKKVNIGARVDPEVQAALAEIAKAERRSISQVVPFMIEAELERRQKGAMAKS
jgi:hypothetical protein